MPIAYLIARPETIFSLINTGKLPENLPDYIRVRDLNLYLTLEEAKKNVDCPVRQAFILAVKIPEIAEANSLTKIKEVHESETREYYQAEWIEPKWIENIQIFQKSTHKLLDNLLNRKCLVPVVLLPPLPILPSYAPSSSQNLPYEESVLTSPRENITYLKKGDLLGSTMEYLVNTVNCVGVMGKGIAFTFKQRYPAMFKDYKKRCDRQEVQIGMPYLYQEGRRKIINFPTKKHWREPSKLEYIEQGLQYLAEHIEEWRVTSMAVPPLGCGNGGLNWEDVQPLIEKYLVPTHIHLEIYLPVAEKKSDYRIITPFFSPSRKTSETKDELKLPCRAGREISSYNPY